MFSFFILPTLILLSLAISVISLRVIVRLPVHRNKFIVIFKMLQRAELHIGHRFTAVESALCVEACRDICIKIAPAPDIESPEESVQTERHFLPA